MIEEGRAVKTPISPSSWPRLIAAVCLLIAVLAAVFILPLHEWLDTAVQWSRSNPVAAGFSYIGLFALGAVFMLPGSAMLMAAGFLFGLVYGIPIAAVASATGAFMAFIAGQTIARPLVLQRIANSPRLAALDVGIRNEAWLIVFLARLSLIVPFAVMNYAFSLTSVRRWPYFMASAVGGVPVVCLYVYLGSVARNIDQLLSGELQAGPAGKAMFVVGLIAVIFIATVIHRAASRALRQHLHLPEETD